MKKDAAFVHCRRSRPPTKCRMESVSLPAATSLLEDLDRRQDEVLAQLDELDQRIAAILAEHSPARATSERAAA
jgi:hypothetical protein